MSEFSRIPLQSIDLAVLILCMIGVFGMGCWLSKRSGKTSEFMAAGRSLPGWAVVLSIFGTYFSSISFLGNTGKAFGGNWNAWVLGLSLPIAAVVAVRCLSSSTGEAILSPPAFSPSACGLGRWEFILRRTKSTGPAKFSTPAGSASA